MSDLTEWLRMIGSAPNLLGTHVKACTEAADEIDRLSRELAGARDKALEDAAEWHDAKAIEYKRMSVSPNVIHDMRWDSSQEARETMRQYAETHETSAVFIRALKGKP